jgi:hypothetical protein
VTYRREYENFTHLPGESIDAMFQRFTVIVNNMRANVAMLPYDDHDRAIKLLHSLDRTVWSEKVDAILESEKYETLMVDELFSKLKSSEVSESVTLLRVSLVKTLGYNLLSISQHLDQGFEVCFKMGCSRLLNSRGDLVCTIIPEGHIFRADFSQCVGSSHCLVVGVSAELWK